MDEGQVEERTAASTQKQQQMYVTSLAKSAELYTNTDLRTKFSITSVRHFGNLDEKLYESKISEEILRYNINIKGAIGELILLAETGTDARLPIELTALPHLFLAATSFIEGTNGMPQDRQYGAELMYRYIRLANPDNYTYFSVAFSKLKEDTNFTMQDFIKAIQETRREHGLDFTNSAMRGAPPLCLIF